MFDVLKVGEFGSKFMIQLVLQRDKDFLFYLQNV